MALVYNCWHLYVRLYHAEHHREAITSRPALLGGVTVLKATATAGFRTPADHVVLAPFQVTAVPYYANANRGTCQMQVWMAENQDVSEPQKQE